MNSFTSTDLAELLRECAERDETIEVDFDADLADRTFDDLGIDSLALFNITTEIENRYGLHLPYDEVSRLATPQGLVKIVNQCLDERA